MARQNISTGSSANDGTGDTLRSAATKINSNFTEIYDFLGTPGDSSTLASSVRFEDSAVLFEGLTADANETRLYVENPTADRSVIIPNASGNIVLDTHTQTLTNKTLTSPTINTAKVGTSLNDTNGNELFKVTATGSAVNEFTVANGASSNGPTLSATGGGSNLNIFLTTKGQGAVQISKAAFTSVTITANGDAADTATYIICNKSTALAVGLNDGTTTGEYRIFTNKGAGVATVTPDNFAGGTSFALAQNEGVTCVWDGSNWFLVGNQSVMTIA